MPLRAPFLRSVKIAGGLRAAAKLLRQEKTDPNTVPTNDGGHERKPKSEASGPPGAGGASEGTSSHDADLTHVYGPIGYTKELFTRFSSDFCPQWAASLSFFSILSLVPTLLCGLAVLGFLIQSPQQATEYVESIVATMLPGKTAQDTARQLISGGNEGGKEGKDDKKPALSVNISEQAATLMKTRGTAGLIGILSLFWSALQIFLNASTPMNAAFRAKETRGFIKLRVVSLGLLFGAGFLFIVSLVPSAGARFFTESLNDYAMGRLFDAAKPAAAFVVTIVTFLAGVAVNAAMYTLIYRYLPSPAARVTWRVAAVGGIVVAVLSEAAKRGFTLYLARFGEQGYNKLYGSLGGLIVLIFWIYYSSMILLLGAEIAKLYSDAQAAKKAKA